MKPTVLQAPPQLVTLIGSPTLCLPEWSAWVILVRRANLYLSAWKVRMKLVLSHLFLIDKTTKHRLTLSLGLSFIVYFPPHLVCNANTRTWWIWMLHFALGQCWKLHIHLHYSVYLWQGANENIHGNGTRCAPFVISKPLDTTGPSFDVDVSCCVYDLNATKHLCNAVLAWM